MEKSKVKRICFSALKVLVLIAAIVGAFAISVWTGLSALVFFAAGFLWGYFLRSLKNAASFVKAFENVKDDFLAGKKIDISVTNEGNASMQVVEAEKKSSKKKEA